MSLYADYLKERTNDLIMEDDHGFATYRYIDAFTVYVIDLYVEPNWRREMYATHLVDKIVKEAKTKGCTTLLGTVCINTKNSDASIKALHAYGLTLKSAQNDIIVMKKEI